MRLASQAGQAHAPPPASRTEPGRLDHADGKGVKSMGCGNRPWFKSQLHPFARDGRKTTPPNQKASKASHGLFPLLKSPASSPFATRTPPQGTAQVSPPPQSWPRLRGWVSSHSGCPQPSPDHRGLSLDQGQVSGTGDGDTGSRERSTTWSWCGGLCRG